MKVITTAPKGSRKVGDVYDVIANNKGTIKGQVLKVESLNQNIDKIELKFIFGSQGGK